MNPHALFDLGAEYNAIMAEIEEADGVLTQELEERHDAIVDRLAGSAANVKTALDMIKRGEDELDVWLDKLARRKASLAKEAERWKNAAMANMIGMRINKLEGVLNGLPVKLAVCESESVEIYGDVPASYCRIIPSKLEPDKKMIKEDIKDGKEVPGAALVRKTYLRVS